MIEAGEREPPLPEYRILRRQPGEFLVVEHRYRDWRRIFGWRRHKDEDFDEIFTTVGEAEEHISDDRDYRSREWLRKRYYPKVVKQPA